MNRLKSAIQKARQSLNIERAIAYLGDGSGEVHDRENPGYYFVRFPQSEDEVGAPVSLPADVNANLPTQDGITVEIGLRRGRPVILGAYYEGLASAGINPLQLNPIDDQVNGLIPQTRLTTFYATRHGDLVNKPFTAVVFPGVLYVAGVPEFFAGDESDLISFLPAAGEHCFASVFIRTDLTLEAFASTPISVSDPLTIVDAQETVAAMTADSYPVWAWELGGDDTELTVDTARQLDLRQAFGAGGGGGASALDDLSDVTLASVAQGDVLTRTASNWQNVNVPIESVMARITGADVAPISMGASTILARLASGSIAAATPAQIKTLLAIVKADISDFGTYRGQLTAARTYYVRTDGSDSNTGLVDSAGGAFLTIPHAIDVASSLDNATFDGTIVVRAGTYTTAIALKSYIGAGLWTIIGDETTPSNVSISVTGDNCFTSDGVLGKWRLKGMKLSTATSGNCIYASAGSSIDFQNIEFGACAGYHISTGPGAAIVPIGDYKITGGAVRHMSVRYSGSSIAAIASITVTLTGTPAFSGFFAAATDQGGIITSSITWSGSATGVRYVSNRLGNIYTAGNGLPGNAAGSVSDGGQYN